MTLTLPRALGLSLVLALAGPARSDSALPEGTWMGWSATTFLLGLMVPVIEEMRVEGDRIEQDGWRLAWDHVEAGCLPTTDLAARPDCALPAPLGAARVRPRAGVLEIVPEGPQMNPFRHQVDAEEWPRAALVGHVWTPRGDDRRIVLARPALIDGELHALERIYYRAPPGAAGWLLYHLVEANLSMGRAFCGIEALHGDPEAWGGFLTHLERVAPVVAEVHRLGHLVPYDRPLTLRRMTLLGHPELPEDLATDVSDLPEEARVAYAAYADWLRAGREPPKGQVILETLAWPVPPALAEIEAACIAYHFDW